MTYVNGVYQAFSPYDETHPNYNEEDERLGHRRFNLTLRSSQVYESLKSCVKKGEFSDDELFNLFKVVANQINKQNPKLNIDIWLHVKPRVDKAYSDQRKRFNIK